MSMDVRSSRRGRPAPTAPAWLLVGGAVAVVIGIGGYLVTRTDLPPVSLEQVQALARSGDFTGASRGLERLREWASTDVERRALVARASDDLQAIRTAFDDLRTRVVGETARVTYAAQSEALRALEAGADPVAAIAARLVRGQLSALRREATGDGVEVVASAPTVEPLPASPVIDEPVTPPAAAVVPPALAPVPASGDTKAVSRPPAASEPAEPSEAAAGEDDPAAAERRQRRQATLTELADLTPRVDDAENSGDFALAVALLGEAAARVRHSDPLYARDLDGRAADLRHLQAFVDGVVGEGRREWRQLRASALQELLESLAPTPRAWLGAGVLAYRAADSATAERCLQRALDDDPTLAADVDGIVRRGRGEPDEPGYAIVDGRFVARRLIAASQRAAAMQQDLARALRRGKVETETLLSAALTPGPEQIDTVVLALRQQQQISAARLEAHAFKQQGFATMTALRERLDAARASALQLIFDEGRYFHPYLEPAVTAERAASYAVVRADVQQRVAVVRAVWEDRAAEVEIPEDFRSELRAQTLCRDLLARFGERDAELELRLAWLHRVPAGKRLTLRDQDASKTEAHEHRLWRRIQAFNEIVAADWSDAERELLERINADRVMLGRRPLAANNDLQRAARAHAREMDELGYMGHFSTAPGRRTPAERMLQEGYAQPAAENCASGDTAADVYASWSGSSAHHRNLLEAAHTEFGIGAAGRHWVADFGTGAEFRANEAFPDDR